MLKDGAPALPQATETNKFSQYREKEHAFFADLLRAKIHRFNRTLNQRPPNEKPKTRAVFFEPFQIMGLILNKK